MSTKKDTQETLLNMGFEANYICKALNAYENTSGNTYNIETIIEIISQLQKDDKQKPNQPLTSQHETNKIYTEEEKSPNQSTVFRIDAKQRSVFLKIPTAPIFPTICADYLAFRNAHFAEGDIRQTSGFPINSMKQVCAKLFITCANIPVLHLRVVTSGVDNPDIIKLNYPLCAQKTYGGTGIWGTYFLLIWSDSGKTYSLRFVDSDAHIAQNQLRTLLSNSQQIVNKRLTKINLYNSVKQYVAMKFKIRIKAVYSVDNRYNCSFTLYSRLANTFGEFEDAIVGYLGQKYDPLRFKILSLNKLKQKWNSTDSLFQIFGNDSTKTSIQVKFALDHYQHNVLKCNITCPNMIKLNSDNALHCPIYYEMKQDYICNEKNLNHLNQFTHLKDEFEDKPMCKYYDQCKAFQRLEDGKYKISDLCHIKLFRHPPRTRNIKLSANMNAMVMNKDRKKNSPLYIPTSKDIHDEQGAYLIPLIQEVIVNGYKYDIDDCKHNDSSILKIVDEKMDCNRHNVMGKPLNRADMLAMVLYTGCDCNYDMCAAQRSGDYVKWKWFDYHLYNAIQKLSVMEKGLFTVYSGLNNVKLDKKSVKGGYFVTYVSTSWRKEVANNFMIGQGMMIQIDSKFKNNDMINCCDVSWISKFPDECEILFTRSVNGVWDVFKCQVLDDINGVQTVSISK